jgi:hypothetical protein
MANNGFSTDNISCTYSIYYFHEINSIFVGGFDKMDRGEIFALIERERERQEILHPIYESSETKNSEVQAITTLINNGEFLSILVEELGEVASALQGDGILKDELIQVASVAIRWLENME